MVAFRSRVGGLFDGGGWEDRDGGVCEMTHCSSSSSQNRELRLEFCERQRGRLVCSCGMLLVVGKSLGPGTNAAGTAAGAGAGAGAGPGG